MNMRNSQKTEIYCPISRRPVNKGQTSYLLCELSEEDCKASDDLRKREQDKVQLELELVLEALIREEDKRSRVYRSMTKRISQGLVCPKLAECFVMSLNGGQQTNWLVPSLMGCLKYCVLRETFCDDLSMYFDILLQNGIDVRDDDTMSQYNWGANIS